jgi:hypothetical protein
MDFLIDPYRLVPPAAGCNIGYATNYLDYDQDPNTGIFSGSGVQPTSAQILASNSYAKRTTFLAEVATRGMIFSEANFESQATRAPGVTTPISCTATGGFTQTFTATSRRYTNISATSHTASSVAVISGVAAGRFNVIPTNATVPAARWLEFGGNCARIVLDAPVIGIGFFMVDAADDFGGGANYSPYTLVLTTSAGEVSYTPVNPSSSFGFWAVIMATGVTISAFEVRWSDFGGDPDDTDYLGIDGLILAKCP